MSVSAYSLRHGFAKLRTPLNQAAFLLKVHTGVYTSAPHSVKMRVLRSYFPTGKQVTFVETGTYFGDTVAALKDDCAEVISIEVDPKLHEFATRRFRSCSNVKLVLGDCAAELPNVLASIAGPAVFWLDGHWSGGITSRGVVDDPILLSLQQIKEHPVRTHVLLIDDARCFDGRESRPHLSDVIALIRSINPAYRILIHQDIISAALTGDSGLTMLWHAIKNIGATLAGQAWSSFIGLLAMPIIIRGFGAEAYGLLSLSLSVIGVSSICDLGIGRAFSKYVAEEGESGSADIVQRSFHTALLMTLSLAIGSSATLFLLTPVLVTKILHVKAALVENTTLVLFLTAASLPAVLLRILLDGMLVGKQRIAVLSAVNAAINTLKIASGLAVVFWHGQVHSLVLCYCLISYLHAAALGCLCLLGQSPLATVGFAWEWAIARQLLRLGTLSTVANASSYFFLYLDRWIIAAFLSMDALGYYSVAFDVASRLSYLGNAVGQAFFPVFARSSRVSREALTASYVHAGKMVAVASTGMGVILAFFAKPILSDWISPTLGANSGPLLSILSIGVVLSCYFNIPATALLAGYGRPEIVATQFLLGTAVHLAICLVTIKWLGAAGVALGFTAAYFVMLLSAHSWLARGALATPALPRFQIFGLPCWLLALAVGFSLSRVPAQFLSHTFEVLTCMGFAYGVYLIFAVRLAYNTSERHRLWHRVGSLIALRPLDMRA